LATRHPVGKGRNSSQRSESLIIVLIVFLAFFFFLILDARIIHVVIVGSSVHGCDVSGEKRRKRIIIKRRHREGKQVELVDPRLLVLAPFGVVGGIPLPPPRL
jgi:hypothetical protein